MIGRPTVPEQPSPVRGNSLTLAAPWPLICEPSALASGRKRRIAATVVIVVLLILPTANAADDESAVPPTTGPAAGTTPAQADTDTTAQAATTTDAEIVPLSPPATQFITGMILMLLPDTYSDDDDWGMQKKIQSGLNVDVDGLKVHTSRRYKDVNHGVWRRVDASHVDPKEHFDLQISLLPRLEPGVPRYRVKARLRIRATARQQRWALGARLYSLSADVVADVEFNADLHFKSHRSALPSVCVRQCQGE